MERSLLGKGREEKQSGVVHTVNIIRKSIDSGASERTAHKRRARGGGGEGGREGARGNEDETGVAKAA